MDENRTSRLGRAVRRSVALGLGAALLGSAMPVGGAGASGADTSLPPRSLRGTIAFVCELDGGANDELCLMDADGSRPVQITNNPGPDRAPTWSPDGRRLVFNSRRDPHPTQPQIYTYDVSSGAAARLSNGPVEDQRASWTPDGAAVVFQRGTFASGFELFRQRLSDGSLTKLTDNPGKVNAAGSFAPDGTRLVLQSNREATGLFPFSTYVVDRLSGTTTKVAAEVTASHDGPRWSPDGRRVAFGAGGDLYVADLSDGSVVAITSGDASDSSPAWSPDGTKLVYQSVPPEPEDPPEDFEDVTSIWVIDVASQAKVVLGEGRTPVWTAAVRAPDYGRLPVEAGQATAAGLVHRTFLLALDRPADPSGLRFWTERLATGTSASRMAASIVASREHQARFGTLVTGAFVDRLYTDGLRRKPEPSGSAFWTSRIERGISSRSGVLLTFARSRELLVRVASAPRG